MKKLEEPLDFGAAYKSALLYVFKCNVRVRRDERLCFPIELRLLPQRERSHQILRVNEEVHPSHQICMTSYAGYACRCTARYWTLLL